MADPQLIFEKYRLVKRIAIGGMGEIFLARQSDTLIDRFIILKSMLPDLAADQSFVDQFLGEARVAATLNHPNIVSIYEVGAWEGIYYIAMEYIDGDDLTRLIGGAQRSGKLIPPVVAAQIILEAATALEHAWLAKDIEGRPLNIVHRDISPQNIMLRRDGVVKVVDFGIARAANLVSKTLTGQVKGKLSYMPPEQLLGTKVDWRADQFSLGVVLWELCTCDRLIKPGTSHLELIETTTKKPMEDPRVVEPSIPDAIAEVILKMGERDADKRYEDWAQIKNDLASFIKNYEHEDTLPTIAQLQEEFIGEELDKKSKEATGSTPQNFMINLQSAGTVPLGRPSSENYDEEDDIATRAHEVPPTDTEKLKATRADTPKSQPAKALATPELSEPADPASSKRSPLGLWVALLFIIVGVGGVFYSQQSTKVDLTTTETPSKSAETQAVPLAIHVIGPVGASISLDGQLMPEKAPTHLRDLEHGEHQIVLSKEGYPPISQTVTLDGSENPLVLNPALPPAFGVAILKSKPKKVGIYKEDMLIGSTGESPLYLAPGENHTLVFKKPGFQEQTLKLKFAAGQTIEQKIVLKRMKKSAKKPARAAKKTAPAPTPTSEPKTERVIETKTIIIEDKLGYFTLRTNPWTNVFINGRPVGATPLAKHKLKAGKHKVRMKGTRDDGTSIDEVRNITIVSGQTNKKRWDFTQ